MNVLCCVPRYPPRSRVGAWITTHEYLRGLVERDHHVDVLQLMASHHDYLHEGVHVHPREWKDYDTPDVVVSHLGDNGEAAHYAKTVGRPSVRMVHGYHEHNRDRLDQYPTDLAIFSSQALADATAWPGPQLVAHPPIWADRYRTTPGDRITLVNLADVKGGDLFRLLAISLPDLAFLGVRGHWGKQIRIQPSNVQIVDPVEDMRTIYQATRILVMPSECESYGRVAVEAACSGIPTVAHRVDGLVEAMGDAAIWIDELIDLDAWTNTLRSLQDTAVWQAASEKAYRRSLTLEPEQTVTKVVTAIEELCE